MKSTLLTSLAFSPLVLAIALQSQAETVELDKVTVSADFRNSEVQDLAEAVTVVGEQQIEQRSSDHLEAVLSYVPNVNFSSGSSRARYYQVRGIGERSQFIDPVNPSVGLMIDGIDMTGLGGSAALFDVQQVEVLRGPQGTRFGANALAGLINIQSKAPTKETEGYIQAEFGTYNTHSQQGAISGSISDNVKGRLAVSSLQSEGYMENVHLDKTNTNNIDEVFARGKLAAQLNENTDLAFSYFYADIDNGYDAFSLDNNRNTYSDEPGVDAQESHAFSVDLSHKLSNALTLETFLATAKSDVEYSYDEDWAFGQYTWLSDDPVYQPDPCDTTQGPCLADTDGYSSFDQYLRNYQRNSFDLRLLSGQEGRIFSDSTDWVAGVYMMQRDEELTRNYTYDPQYKSELIATSLSVYAELGSQLTANTRLIYGVRAEQWRNDFENTLNTDSDETENLWGGKITLENMLNNQHLAYVSLARGYKPGGANSADVLTEEERVFDTELNNTFEMGLKSSLLQDKLQTAITTFIIQRKDQQVKQYFTELRDDNSYKFHDYIGNASEGRNQGIEFESSWQFLPSMRWDLVLGYLDTEFVDYEFSAQDDDNPTAVISQDGRAQAQAPEYSFATALINNLSDEFTLTIESEGKDSYFFSDNHDEKSMEYVLWHARLTWQQNNYSLAMYGRNLTAKEQQVRGFSFPNDPRDGYSNTRWTQSGEPRLIGIEGRYNF